MFSKEKVNLGRQPELDLLKAFTVVFSMILIHVFDWDTTMFDPGFVMKIISKVGAGIWGAPVFMFAMGMGLKYGHRQTPGEAAWRGLKLLAFGQTLNLCRYAVPFGLGALMGIRYTGAYQMLNFSVDIMQFAGLAFLLTALTWKLGMKSYQTLLLALGMSVAGSLLWFFHVETDNYLMNQLLGFLWGTDTESFFPFLNWYIFVAAGQWFARWYQRVEDKKRFFAVFAPISALVTVLYTGAQITGLGDGIFYSMWDEPHAFCWMWLPDSFCTILTFMLPLGFCYWLSGKMSDSVLRLCSHPSRNINRYYNVSWVWITMSSLFVAVNCNAGLWFYWIVILGLTILTVIAYNTFLAEKTEAFCARHAKTLMVLVWVVSLGLALWAYCNYPAFPNVFNDNRV